MTEAGHGSRRRADPHRFRPFIFAIGSPVEVANRFQLFRLRDDRWSCRPGVITIRAFAEAYATKHPGGGKESSTTTR